MAKIKCYRELIKIPSYEDRIEYLKTNQRVGDITYGGRRSINQMLYHDPFWKSIRLKVIARDSDGDHVLDLAHPDYEIVGKILIHHIMPISAEDIINRNPMVFDLDNLVCTAFKTHEIIHYESTNNKKIILSTNRHQNDTKLW